METIAFVRAFGTNRARRFWLCATSILFGCAARQATIDTPGVPPRGEQTTMEGNNSSASLQLEIAATQGKECRGACLDIRLRHARGKRAYWVNADLSVTSDANFRQTIVLEVRNEQTGEVASPSCYSRPNLENPKEYLVFVPGTELRREVSLSCFALPEGTSWRVIARYKDVNASPPSAPQYATWLRDELVSNEVVVTSTGWKRSDP
jgi:hypothetical protein